MTKATDKIKYPISSSARRNSTTSGKYEITGRMVIVSIIDLLSEVAETVESAGTSKVGPFRRRTSDLQGQQLVDAIVDAANSLTSIFNNAANEKQEVVDWPPSLEFAPYRNMIVRELKTPLENLEAKKTLLKEEDVMKYKATLDQMISGLKEILASESTSNRWSRALTSLAMQLPYVVAE